MRKTIARIAVLAGLLIIASFAVVVVNQTAQLVALADRASPLFGNILFWSLIALFAFCIAVPLYLLLRLPRPLKAPDSETDPRFPEHLERLQKRLRSNPHLRSNAQLRELDLTDRGAIDQALVALDDITGERVRQAASQVFITTAISQNGSLDGFLVLAAQSKLVLEIARIYYQRPTMRDLVYLYSNVAATAFVAGEIEDLDISEQIQPVIAAVFGSAAGAIPGFGAASTLFVNSVMGGAANAFLTLRVGVIARQYCRAVVLPPRRSIRRTAILEATQMLGGVALTGTRRVATAMGSAARNSVGGAFESFGDQIKAAGLGIRDRGANVIDRLKWRPEES